MIWVIVALVIIAISFFLAYRSMRNYSEAPSEALSYGVYLIRNPEKISEEFLSKLLNLSLPLNSIFSFERLQKGSELAYVLYIPKQLVISISELNILELEDYLPNVNDTIAWEITSLINPKLPLQIKPGLFGELELNQNQGLFFQIVSQPNRKTPDTLESIIRIMINEKDTNQRIELAKKVNSLISQNSNLNQVKREASTMQIYSDYKKRVKTSQVKGGLNLVKIELVSLVKI